MRRQASTILGPDVVSNEKLPVSIASGRGVEHAEATSLKDTRILPPDLRWPSAHEIAPVVLSYRGCVDTLGLEAKPPACMLTPAGSRIEKTTSTKEEGNLVACAFVWACSTASSRAGILLRELTSVAEYLCMLCCVGCRGGGGC